MSGVKHNPSPNEHGMDVLLPTSELYMQNFKLLQQGIVLHVRRPLVPC